MDARIKTRSYRMPAATADYLDQRIASLEKLVGKSKENVRIEVELGRDAGRPRHGKNIWFAEMRVIVPGNDDIYACNNSESVNGAIDDVKDEIERQLRARKRVRIQSERKSGALAKRMLRGG